MRQLQVFLSYYQAILENVTQTVLVSKVDEKVNLKQ